MKIHPVGTESFHADRQTDTTKLTVAFCIFANTPNNSLKQDDVSTHSIRNILMVKEAGKNKNSNMKLMESSVILSSHSRQVSKHTHMLTPCEVTNSPLFDYLSEITYEHDII